MTSTKESSAPRVGVYVCHCGGNISDVVDCSQVAKVAAELPNVVVSKEHIFMCSDPAQLMIQKDIKEQKLPQKSE